MDSSQKKLDFQVTKVTTRSKSTTDIGTTEDTEGAIGPGATVVLPEIQIEENTDGNTDGKSVDTDDNEKFQDALMVNIDKDGTREKDLRSAVSTHTRLPEHLKTAKKTTDDPFEEEPVVSTEITINHLLKYKIQPFTDESELPTFIHATKALQYFRVLRDQSFNIVRSKHHLKTLLDSKTSDQTPPGLRLKKNLEVIEGTPFLKLQALQIMSEAETKLAKVITEHYKQSIPKIEKEFIDIFESMKRITMDEKSLINMKLLHYNNELIRQQKDKRDKKTKKPTGEASKNDGETPPQNQEATNQFPWEQKPQRQRPKGRGKPRGKNFLNL